MQTIATSFNFKKNSFSFLRFLFAILILYFHTFLLGGFGEEPLSRYPVFNEGIGRIAVYGFFVISGFLVTRSYLNSPGFVNYGFKRFLRIFPGFWVNLLITAFGFATLIYFLENHGLREFLSYKTEGPVNYVTMNFTTLMHQYNISNLLRDNSYPHVFNGSLWTLFLEVKAYILLGAIGLFGIVRAQKFIILLIFITLWLLIIFEIPINSSTNKFIRLIIDESFLLYATYFFAGSVLYLFRRIVPLNNKVFYVSIFLVILLSLLNLLHQSLPILFPIITIGLANNLPFQNFDKYGDFSYGIYLYAFPVQQLVTYFNFNRDPLSYFILCFTLTISVAFLSWHFIEKPFLGLKKLAVFKSMT